MKRFILIAAIFIAPIVRADDEMKLISVDHQEQFTVTIKGEKFSMTRKELSGLVEEADKAMGTRRGIELSQPCPQIFHFGDPVSN